MDSSPNSSPLIASELTTTYSSSEHMFFATVLFPLPAGPTNITNLVMKTYLFNYLQFYYIIDLYNNQQILLTRIRISTPTIMKVNCCSLWIVFHSNTIATSCSFRLDSSTSCIIWISSPTTICRARGICNTTDTTRETISTIARVIVVSSSSS